MTAEIPGLEEKDFELGLREGTLLLKGEKRHAAQRPVHRIQVETG